MKKEWLVSQYGKVWKLFWMKIERDSLEISFSDLEASEEGEPAISDDLEAEYTEENPFLFEGDEDDVTNAEVNTYCKF